MKRLSQNRFQLLLILRKEYRQKAGSDYYKLPTAVEASASFRVTAAAGETSVDAAVGAALTMTFCGGQDVFAFLIYPSRQI